MEAAINVLIVSKAEESLVEHLLKGESTIHTTFIKDFVEEDFLTSKLTNFFEDSQADVILLCDSFQTFSILELIKLFKQTELLIPTVVISKRNETKLAVEVMKAGAENFLVEGTLDCEELLDAIYSALQAREEQKRVKKVEIENKKLLQAIEQSPVSVVITKADTNKIEYANPMFTKLTGYTSDEIHGKSPKLLKSGKKTKSEYRNLWDTILSGSTWHGEFINRKKDGELYCVNAVISPIKVNNNETTHFVGIHQDISEKKEAELKLKKKSEELEQAYQAIEANIKKATNLHRHFFPTSLPKISNLEMEAFYEPAHGIGSDYYNVIQVKHQLLLYVVDVSGSGIDGAFINIFIRQKINRFLYLENLDKEISPKELLNFMANQFVKEKFPEEYFICLYVSVLDLETNNLTYSNAGIQVPPVIISNGQMHTLQLGGLPITCAIDSELLVYEEESIYFSEDSTMLISTDGIVESVINGEMYGIERLHKLVLDHYFLPPYLLKNAINEDIAPIINKHITHDDITYVILQNGFEIIDKKSFQINSDCNDVECVVGKIKEWLFNYTAEVNILLVGFNEIVYNAIEHGNKFDVSKQVSINIEVKKSHILITVEDEGEGFNWRSQMKKTLDITNFEERGRGIIFTKASFDYITYNDKGNVAYLYKQIG